MPNFLHRKFPLVFACGAIALPMLFLAGCKSEEPIAEAAPDYTHQLGPGESGLRKLGPNDPLPDIGAAWRVRDPFLNKALASSLGWFQMPSTKSKFPFMNVATWDQASSSIVAFQQILQDSKDEASFVGAIKQQFEIWQTVGWNGKGTVLFTGYYSPEFNGSLTPTDEFKYPLFKRPADLVTDPSTGEPKGQRAADGSVHPYPTRAEIESSNMFKGTELVYLRSPLDAYIVQVNGSAKILLPDGKPMFVGYSGKTDRPYVGLGKSCVDAGLIPKDKLSLKAIMDEYKKNPAQITSMMAKNESYVFFTTYDGGNWPAGSLGFKVTEKETLATDKKVYPAGGVVLVDTQGIDFGGKKQRFLKFMLDQDTGGAIQAPGRADIYMGIGPAAEILAGGQYAEGTMYYFFLKPDCTSQYPLPAAVKSSTTKGAEPTAKMGGPASKPSLKSTAKPATPGLNPTPK
ncbi:MAG: MltA domain-containing protein [Planctomycetes bacterium]|nr:MltA domain-containing protein [Planctomycetota bacterium]